MVIIITKLHLTITDVVVVIHANDSRGGKVFIHVCLSVCMVTQKQMIKVFKLGIGNDLSMILELNGQRSRHRITKCKNKQI